MPMLKKGKTPKQASACMIKQQRTRKLNKSSQLYHLDCKAPGEASGKLESDKHTLPIRRKEERNGAIQQVSPPTPR